MDKHEEEFVDRVVSRSFWKGVLNGLLMSSVVWGALLYRLLS